MVAFGYGRKNVGNKESFFTVSLTCRQVTMRKRTQPDKRLIEPFVVSVQFVMPYKRKSYPSVGEELSSSPAVIFHALWLSINSVKGNRSFFLLGMKCFFVLLSFNATVLLIFRYIDVYIPSRTRKVS